MGNHTIAWNPVLWAAIEEKKYMDDWIVQTHFGILLRAIMLNIEYFLKMKKLRLRLDIGHVRSVCQKNLRNGVRSFLT